MKTNGSQFGVNTYSYMYKCGVVDCLTHLAGRGYSRFELMMFPGHIWPSEMDRTQRASFRSFLGTHSLEITSLNQPNIDINLAGATPEMRDYSRRAIVAAIELAADIGCGAVVIGPGKPNLLLPLPRSTLLGWFHEALDAFLPLSRRTGVQILVENMPISFLPTAEELMSALDAYGDASVGIVYDIANAAFIKEDLDLGLQRVAPRLKLVHLSDTRADACEHRAFGTSVGIVAPDALGKSLSKVALPFAPIFEIISTDPDGDLSLSEAALRGWPNLARAHA